MTYSKIQELTRSTIYYKLRRIIDIIDDKLRIAATNGLFSVSFCIDLTQEDFSKCGDIATEIKKYYRSQGYACACNYNLPSSLKCFIEWENPI